MMILVRLSLYSPAEQDAQHPEKAGKYASGFRKVDPEDGEVRKYAGE